MLRQVGRRYHRVNTMVSAPQAYPEILPLVRAAIGHNHAVGRKQAEQFAEWLRKHGHEDEARAVVDLCKPPPAAPRTNAARIGLPKVRSNGATIAIEEAAKLRDGGFLFRPAEAMMTASQSRGTVQTLYSVARMIADQTNEDWETILKELEMEFPLYR